MQSLQTPYTLKDKSLDRIRSEYPDLDIVHRDGRLLIYNDK